MFDIILTVAVLAAFMVACPVLCFFFSIFSDTLNLNGSFDSIGESIVGLIFIPFIILFKIIDAITSPFVDPTMKYAIDHRNDLRAN
ncbi:MAG: hypothetical protein A2X83_12380 [Desulfuromonadales bacterium GWD2_54_10]|nr:MAG: hypothetical protein A2X83_12380 [Desulfuromonadales bacterium GWD2_54_10]